ncbi:MAG TPA: V4R domain-containing protein [Gemmataceae bacterium]|jgi:hypothetical protein|nr:V4R domain-containing protein [Gemmataceae bacterium]
MPLELARTTAETLSRLHHVLHAANGDEQTLDPAHPATAQQPFRHSYYAPDQFFQEQPGGVIQTIYGQRVLRAGTSFFPALLNSLVQIGGVEPARLMYRFGQQLGQQEMDAFVPRIEREFEVPFEKMHLGVMLETWWWPYRAKGWGDWRCDFQHAANGLILVDIFDSFVAAALGQTGRCVCDLYAGLFAALFSRIASRELGCIELRCASAGAPHCQFLIAIPQRIEAATRWREQGHDARAVLKSLGATG